MVLAEREKDIDIENEETLDSISLGFIYSSLPYILLGQILGALILSVMLLGSVDSQMLWILLGLSLVVSMYLFYVHIAYKIAIRNDELINSKRWIVRYNVGVLMSGLIWGISSFLIIPDANTFTRTVVLLFLLAAGSIYISILAQQWKLLLAYTAIIFTPTIFRLFTVEDGAYRLIAYAIMALILVMIISAKYHSSLTEYLLDSYNEYAKAKSSDWQYRHLFSSLEQAPVGFFYFDKDMVIKEVNTRFIQIMGKHYHRDIVGKNLLDVWDNEKILGHHKKALEGFDVESPDPILIDAVNEDDWVFVDLFSSPIYSNENEIIGGISIVIDVTSELNSGMELARMMDHDLLTGLPNRKLLLKYLKNTVADKLRDNTYGAVLFLDIDHFNNINMMHGQKIGDKILKRISVKFKEAIEDNGVVSRIWADTFVFLIPSLTENAEGSKQEVTDFVAKLRKIFEKLFVVGDADYYIDFTVGVTLFNNNDLSANELLKLSESALFEGKGNGRGSIRFYEKDLHGSTLRDIAIANDIYKAIGNNEFEIYYQPQQDIHNGILTGAEALVRWNHPQKGSISPAHFIPIAEEFGAIIELEEWIFNRIFQDMRSMSEALVDFPLNYIAINVSSGHFLQPNFVEKFTHLLHKHRINPLWVNIEITESGLMRNIDEAIERIHELKRLGFGFSIDDFGTGYSSLSYLKKLPVDIIKIDRSFVKDADRNKSDRLIVEAVIEISQKFGFKVLAEGIDRQETLDYFKTTSCKTFQGYLYYKPIVMEEFIQLI